MNKIKARDLMTRDIKAARAVWSVNRLAEFLVESNISGAPVLSEDGQLIGVVSLTDIVRYMTMPEHKTSNSRTPAYYLETLENTYTSEEINAFRVDQLSSESVHDVMTPVIFDVSEETPMGQIADLMVRGHIHRVFVTRDQTVVGIITALDLLKNIR